MKSALVTMLSVLVSSFAFSAAASAEKLETKIACRNAVDGGYSIQFAGPASKREISQATVIQQRFIGNKVLAKLSCSIPSEVNGRDAMELDDIVSICSNEGEDAGYEVSLIHNESTEQLVATLSAVNSDGDGSTKLDDLACGEWSFH